MLFNVHRQISNHLFISPNVVILSLCKSAKSAMCGSAWESVGHAVFGCRLAKKIMKTSISSRSIIFYAWIFLPSLFETEIYQKKTKGVVNGPLVVYLGSANREIHGPKTKLHKLVLHWDNLVRKRSPPSEECYKMKVSCRNRPSRYSSYHSGLIQRLVWLHWLWSSLLFYVLEMLKPKRSLA